MALFTKRADIFDGEPVKPKQASDKQAWSIDAVRDGMIEQSGKQFNPKLCDAWLGLLKASAALPASILDESL